MKISILGAGPVGITLAENLVKYGHEIYVGTRNPLDSKFDKIKEIKGVSILSQTEAVNSSEVVFLTTPWSATEKILQEIGAETFAEKIVVDVTNPLDFSKGKPELALGLNTSAGEIVQSILNTAKVVKAFNTISKDLMVNPRVFSDGNPSLLICGNDLQAKKTVSKIAEDFGWEVVDFGNIDRSRLLEPLAMIWITYTLDNKTAHHAFKMLR